MTLKNLTLPVFVFFAVVILALTYAGKLPNDLMGAFGFIFVTGLIFGEIGDRLPIVKDYLGGGPIMCIFGPAFLVYEGWVPKYVVDIIKNFMDKTNFFAFFISFLLGGALLTMSRKIVLQASLRYIPALFGGIILSFALAMGVGALTGYGARKALYMVAIPVMGGGVGAGALPLSQIYAAAANIDPAQMLSMVMPAVVLGNVLSILGGVIMDRVGRAKPRLTGNGMLMKIENKELLADIEKEKQSQAQAPDIQLMGAGFFLCVGYYLVALAIQTYLFPKIHAFVWLILMLAATKALHLLPDRLELGTIQWSQTWVKNLIYAALIPIGLSYTDLSLVGRAVSNPGYLLTIVVTVIGAVIGAGLVGELVGLYFVESGISAGLCMSNMAQTGDLAVLGAAKRMDLMPFAAYSSRIGGSLILIMATVLVSVLGF
jgi:malate:Na+ symporter